MEKTQGVETSGGGGITINPYKAGIVKRAVDTMDGVVNIGGNIDG